MSGALDEYCKDLIAAERQARSDFDKTVLTLSGGGLGVSFAFVRQFVVDGVAIAPRWLTHNRHSAPGSWYDRAVVILNAAGAVAFVVGVVLAGVFASRNVR